MSQQINLINPQLLKKRYAFGLREMALALGGILAVALAWAGYLHYQAGGIESQADAMEARQATAQQELDRLSAVASQPVSPLLAERVQAAQTRVTQGESLMRMIEGTIQTTSVGFSPRMRALALSDAEGVWLNGFTLAPDYVELKGAALNATLLTTYMDRLGKQPPFSGLKFSGLNASQASAEGGSPDNAVGLPEHIGFSLFAGRPRDPANAGGDHVQ